MKLIAWLLIRKDGDEYTIKIEKIIRVLKVKTANFIKKFQWKNFETMKNAIAVKILYFYWSKLPAKLYIIAYLSLIIEYS